MEFAFLPPEINSARMYSGPGSGSLLAAAGSWDSLSAELGITAETYESVLSALTTFQWRGPASEAMAATAAHYVGWLQTTAEQTKQTAMQARAAAAAYEQAYRMTVPPPAIAANRTQLASLIATNILGQNTAAIAATEAQYADYWAQDAAAMYGYALSSATAARFAPFSSAQQTANPAAQSVQNVSVTQAVNSAASNPVLQALSGILPSNSIIPEDFTALDGILATYSTVNATYYIEAFASGVIGAEKNLGVLPSVAAAAPAPLPPTLTAAPQLSGAASGAGLGNVTVRLAGARTIGPMSVPASWAAPSTSHVGALEPAGLTTLPGTEEAAASGYPGYPGMPAAAGSRGPAAPPRYGVRLTVMPRPPAAG